jgi:nucleotide-binding universal stress UspA family protein
VTEEVLRRATAPVLAANAGALASEGPISFGKILVALDGSERAAKILPLVREIATLFGSKVTVLHVVPRFVGHAAFPFTIPAPLTVTLDGPEEILAEQTAPLRASGVDVKTTTIYGETAPFAIVDIARREEVDLIALTTHGRTGLSRWIFGSVAEEVLRSSPCPVLLERTVSIPIEEPIPATAV